MQELNINEISFFYIVTVGNPSSSILSNPRRKRLVKLVSDLSDQINRKIPLIWDAAYENLIHDKTVLKPESGLIYDTHGLVFELGTMSKVLAPGVRIGYMIGEDSPFMNAMIQRTSDVGFSGPLINQETVSNFIDKQMEEQLGKVNTGYSEKASILAPYIKEQLGDYLEEVIGGTAGFYFYLTFKGINTDETSDFYKLCSRITGIRKHDLNTGGNKKARVVYIPGEFCVNPNGEMVSKGNRQLRISYGFEDTQTIKKGIDILKEAAEYAAQRIPAH